MYMTHALHCCFTQEKIKIKKGRGVELKVQVLILFALLDSCSNMLRSYVSPTLPIVED